jgi:hypothetical protein
MNVANVSARTPSCLLQQPNCVSFFGGGRDERYNREASTSDTPQDILKAYDLQASCYVSKPADLKEFERTMNAFQEFCLTVVKLPRQI